MYISPGYTLIVQNIYIEILWVFICEMWPSIPVVNVTLIFHLPLSSTYVKFIDRDYHSQFLKKCITFRVISFGISSVLYRIAALSSLVVFGFNKIQKFV